jgi:hypothetical protein
MPTASTYVPIVGAGPLAEALATSFTSGNEELLNTYGAAVAPLPGKWSYSPTGSRD